MFGSRNDQAITRSHPQGRPSSRVDTRKVSGKEVRQGYAFGFEIAFEPQVHCLHLLEVIRYNEYGVVLDVANIIVDGIVGSFVGAEHLAALLTDAYPILAADADKEVHSEYASIAMKAGFKASYPMFKA